MPKFNFNVPFLDVNGDPVKQPKINRERAKPDANGNLIYDYVKDEDGYVVMEEVLLKSILADMLSAPYKDDDQMAFGDRAIRGKLARKIQCSSTANYRDKDLAMIKELAAKSKATLVLLQLDLLLNGRDEDYEISKAETAEPAQAVEAETQPQAA